MYEILPQTRLNIENEFMALVMNKHEVINLIQVKPEYLVDERNKILLDVAIKCYQKYGTVKFDKLFEFNQKFDIAYCSYITTGVMWFPSGWKEQLKLSEESIVKFYKEDIIKSLNEKLKKNEINYDEFMNKMKKIDSIVLTETSTTLSKKEIIENINVEKSKINFNNFERMNNTLRLVRGDFLIIGATTGAGKSGFMLNLMNDLMTSFQCIYFNMEMSKSTIYKRLISINTNIEIDDITKPQTEYQKQNIEKGIDRIENAGLIVEHKANDIKQIRGVVSKLKNKDKHTILFIDHLGLTKADGTKSLYEQSTEVAKQLRQMCLEHDCTVISASQLNRSAYNSETLSLSMLKDSGELENSASKVILLSKENKEDNSDTVTMVVDIVKNRDGICGSMKMNYDKKKQIFKEEI